MGHVARIIISLACAPPLASPAVAQGVRVDLLPPLGTEVRATLSADGEERRAEGILTEASVEGLVLEADRGRRVYRIPAEILLGLDVSLGRNHARGAALGFVFGALGTGLVLGGAVALAGDDGGADCWVCSPRDRFLLGGAVGGVLGGGVGLVVGAVIGTDRWEPVW